MSPGNIRLLLESGDGSPAKEYRIEDGNVEVKTVDGGSYCGTVWWRLTPGQLSTHVKRNTLVARWVEHHLGWRRLLLACVGPRT